MRRRTDCGSDRGRSEKGRGSGGASRSSPGSTRPAAGRGATCPRSSPRRATCLSERGPRPAPSPTRPGRIEPVDAPGQGRGQDPFDLRVVEGGPIASAEAPALAELPTAQPDRADHEIGCPEPPEGLDLLAHRTHLTIDAAT